MVREAESLRSIAREPGRTLVLWLSDGAPFQEHRDLFDKAFAACRQALRAKPDDVAVRVNLGALYLWRDAIHNDESGNFEKAIDQFLIVLGTDSRNDAALTYLRAHEVLSRMRPELAEKGMRNIRAVLQQTLQDSPSVGNLHTFARVMLFDGRALEALPVAVALVRRSPVASSHLLLGSVELKSSHPDKAFAAFQAALKLTADPAEAATARLGAAQALHALGRTDDAARMLTDATASLPSPGLERAARVAGLDTPAELGWSIGKTYAASGNALAVDFLGVEGVSWLSSELASQKNAEGVKLFQANHLERARDLFFAAAELIPMDPVYWRNAAVVSFDLGRYEESMVAYRRADARKPLDVLSAKRLAIAYAILGDYRNGRAMFEKAAREFPEGKNPSRMTSSTWAVALSYAVGGWDEAVQAWSRLERNGGAVPRDDWYDIFAHVWGGMRDIAGRVTKRGANYQSLRHESVVYRILGEGLSRHLLSREGREEIRQGRVDTLNRIISIYSRLPLKPAITPDVLELVRQAQPFVNSAFENDTARYKAVALYEQVIERAPWWPEGHYTLALLACWNPSMYAFGEVSNRDSGWVAGREMNAYLALIPEGRDAVAARKLLKGCSQR